MKVRPLSTVALLRGMLVACCMPLPMVMAATTPEATCSAMLSAATPAVSIQTAQYQARGRANNDPQAAMTGASAAGTDLPGHCLIRGMINARTGADGRSYGTRFELRLPDNWQRRFMFQGGGGLDGFLAQSVGSIPIHGSTAQPALTRGYAVVSMDGGHQGTDASFAHDQQARLDYAYVAIGKVTDTAKRLITQYYGKSAERSYFMGCSNGGREAMIAAQRYPTEFDGVVAGNPGFHLSRAAVAEAWDTQAFMSIAPKDDKGRAVLAHAFNQADLDLLSKKVLQVCDAKDGITDGLINNHQACHFDPAVLQCHGDKDASCLSAAQVGVLHKVFGGPKNSHGEALYSTWPYDAGISASGWRSWKLGSSSDAAKPDARNVVLGGSSLKEFYMTPPDIGFDPLAFDFDRDVARVAETGALNDAVSTYLNTFEARGGKLIIIQGLSDPVFSADDIAAWYERTGQNTDGGDRSKQAQWARLFMVPGMTHCGGGPALDDMDPLAAVEKWVEHGEAPASIPARGKNFRGKEQPLCPYPSHAQYQGGDADKLEAYVCSAS